MLYFYLVYWTIYELFVVLTGMIEEVGQIDVVDPVGIFGKTDSTKEDRIYFRRCAVGVMNAAEINKIESASAHNEKRLKEVALIILCRSKIADDASLCAELELANSREHAVHLRGICEQIGLELNSALAADVLLLGF